MKPVPHANVRNWAQVGIHSCPRAITAVCPECTEKVLFDLKGHQFDDRRETMASTGVCPGCGTKVHVWTFRPKTPETKNALYQGSVFMHPTARDHHEAIQFSTDIPEALARAYHSTVDSYNSGNYAATAVCCRRTLEGLFTHVLNEERIDRLAEAIDKAVSTVDLAKPLRDLSHAIRTGGNLGAHFNSQNEPTKPMARAMVELLEYIVSYLYVLPNEIAKLDKELSGEK